MSNDPHSGNVSLAWAMVDALFLMIPFAGPGAGLARSVAGPTVFAMSQAGLNAAAVYGYGTALIRSMVPLSELLGNINYSTTGSSGLSSGSYGTPGWNMKDRATRYQKQIVESFADPPPTSGGEFKYKGRWLDGVKLSINKIVEAKGPGYEQLIKDIVDKKGIMVLWDNLLNEMRAHAEIARETGGAVDWHVAEKSVADRLRQASITEGVDDVVNVIHTPAR